MMVNGDGTTGKTAYAWFVWEKGNEKETVIRFIPSPKWKDE